MKKYNVPALEKAMAILDMLSLSDQEYTVTEIYTQLAIPKATVFMILSVLESFNMIKKSAHGRYTLGAKIYSLGMSYMTKMDLKKIAKPHMEELCKDTGFTSHLGIILDGGILFIEKVELQSFIKFSTFPGMRAKIHNSSLGKAIAAHLPKNEADALIDSSEMGRYTPNTITDKERFKDMLELIRKAGYSIEDEEGEIGVRCIGAPIFDTDGKVVAAVSITALKSHLSVDLFQKIGEKVKETANKISIEIGYEKERAQYLLLDN